MKTLPTILAATLLLVTAFAPLAVNAAGIVTFTSPTAGATISGAYSVTGTVSPAPSGADNLFISVTNPASNIVGIADVPVTPVTGAFGPVPFTTGTGSTWPSGTYTITATDSNAATGSITFNFVATTPPPSSGLALQLWATASTPVNGGSSAQVEALTEWNNGTFAKGVTFTTFVITPNGQAAQVSGSPTSVSGQTGAYWWTIPTTSSQMGLWVVIITATSGSYTVLTQTSFTVGDFATGSALTSLSNGISSLTATVNAIQTSLTSVASGVSSISSTVGAIQTSLGSLTTTVNTINTNLNSLTGTVNSINTAVGQIQTNVGNLQTAVNNAVTAATNAQNAANAAKTSADSAHDSIGNVSTYVLVAVVIAAIILVLELAILVRKLS